MKLPKWMPFSSKPFFIDWRECHEAMTDNQKRWDFVINWIISIVAVFVLISLDYYYF